MEEALSNGWLGIRAKQPNYTTKSKWELLKGVRFLCLTLRNNFFKDYN